MNTPQENIEKKIGMNEGMRKTKKKLFNTLTDWYFDIKDFENNGKIYEKIGIKTRKKIVLNTAGRIVPKQSSGYHLQSGNTDDINNTINGSKINEAIHIMFVIQSIINGITNQNIGMTVVVGFHFYLVMLQRYNRGRLNQLLDKKKTPDLSEATL